MLHQSFRPTHLHRLIRRSYNLPTSSDYFINQQDSRLSITSKRVTLRPLPGSNHNMDTTDEIDLLGVPHGVDAYKSGEADDFRLSLKRIHPDLIFLPISPEQYITRQRFLSQKHAINEVEDYDVKAMPSLNPECPLSFEECIVNLNVLDMLEKNKLYDDLNLTRGIAAYSYPELQAKTGEVAGLPDLMKGVQRHIIGHPDSHSEIKIINEALYKAVAGKHKVLLGEIPESLYRRRIATEFSLENLQDIFKYLLEELDNTRDPISIREAAVNYLPHIFQAPKDLYYTALLKESFQAAQNITAMVGMAHINPIQNLWMPPPDGINFTRATSVSDRRGKESDEQVIEKHALLDVLLETRPWGKPFINNPFPYLVDDITLVPEGDLGNMVNCFRFHYEKYLRFKKAFENKKGFEIEDYKFRKIQLLEQGNFKIGTEPLEAKSLKEKVEKIKGVNRYEEPKRLEEFGKQAFHFK